jgi:16S rRNA processing protein RimM
MNDKIFVAKLGRAIGLKGSLKIHIDSDFPEQFKPNTTLYTQKNQTLIIESFQQKNSTIKFVDIDTVEDAKKLTNKLLYVSKQTTKENCDLQQNEYFWFDIIECELFENDQLLGKVADIQRLPLADYLTIDTSKELVEQNYPKQFLIPYNDTYILEVNIENKTILGTSCKDILEAS